MSRTAGARPRFALLATALDGSRQVMRALFAAKMWTALPLVVMLLLLAGILGIFTLVPAIAPFVYPLF